MSDSSATDVRIGRDGPVGTIALCRPPNNFVDVTLLGAVVRGLEAFDADPAIRTVVLHAEGKHFCAGANLAGRAPGSGPPRDPISGRTLYEEAARLLMSRKPIIAAVHGAAVGAGLGLAVTADFRVTCTEARFTANFNRLGYHPGFGLTHTLPRLIGEQKAALLFYTGRRITGEEAVAIGLADQLAPQDGVFDAAMALAREIAECAPLSIMANRAIMRQGLVEAFVAATEREDAEQAILRQTEDYREGVRASAERRTPAFQGR